MICRAVGYVLPTLPTSLFLEPELSSGRERSVSLDLPFGTLFLSLFDQYLALLLLSVILRQIFLTFFILATKLLFLIVLTLVLPGRSGLL